jgi:hypothetical protein
MDLEPIQYNLSNIAHPLNDYSLHGSQWAEFFNQDVFYEIWLVS